MFPFTPFCQPPKRLFHTPGPTPFISNHTNAVLIQGRKEAVLFSFQLPSPTNLALLEFQACWRSNIMHGEKRSLGSSSFGFEPKICSLHYVGLLVNWASLVAQMVKNLPAMQDTWVWSLGGKDPLEKGMATHSSILSWRIPRTEEPGGLQSLGSQSCTRLSDQHLHFHFCELPNTPSLSIFIFKRGKIQSDLYGVMKVTSELMCPFKNIYGVPIICHTWRYVLEILGSKSGSPCLCGICISAGVLPRWLSGKRIYLPMQEAWEMRVWSLSGEDLLE